MLFFIPFNVVPALAQTKITVGVAAMSPRTIPLIIAQEQGLFAKQGIEARVVLIKGAPILVASLVSGELEVGYTGGTSVLGAAAQGSYLKILSSVSSKLTHTMLASPNLKTAEQLHGNVSASRVWVAPPGCIRSSVLNMSVSTSNGTTSIYW
jgi:ABC-type nitrate/sulfonate/bicarbonate transport system substrate-binding protein